MADDSEQPQGMPASEKPVVIIPAETGLSEEAKEEILRLLETERVDIIEGARVRIVSAKEKVTEIETAKAEIAKVKAKPKVVINEITVGP